MAITQCNIELDSDKLVAGETLRGRFELQADGSTRCRSVAVKIGWETSGRGDRDDEVHETITVHKGDIPHDGVSDSFEVTLPEGPISHRGHYINLHWYVTVHADIPWGFDFKEKAEFVLDAKEVQPPS